ncbi:MAG: ADP-heptose--LPS heptosyltransferase, partial [Rhodospirillaceae bacterium]
MTVEHILVISALGLGRFVASLGSAAAIRAHHRGARVTLITTPATEKFAKAAPYFDDVWVDDARGAWDVSRLLKLGRRLRARSFDQIYDLDGSPASKRLFWLMYGLRGLPVRRKVLPWSGTIGGTAFTYDTNHWNAMHLTDR